MAPPAKKRKCSENFSKDCIRLFVDSLLNQRWVRQSMLSVFCVHATWKFWRLAYETTVRLAARFTRDVDA